MCGHVTAIEPWRKERTGQQLQAGPTTFHSSEQKGAKPPRASTSLAFPRAHDVTPPAFDVRVARWCGRWGTARACLLVLCVVAATEPRLGRIIVAINNCKLDSRIRPTGL